MSKSASLTFQGEAGTFWSFKTEPCFANSGVTDTGRNAAFLVLGRENEFVLCVVLAGVFSDCPTIEQVCELPFLINKRFFFERSPTVAAHFAFDTSFECLKELRCLGRRELRPDAAKLWDRLSSGHAVVGYGSAKGYVTDAECEWAWENDRVRILAEHAIAEATRKKQEEERKEREDAYLMALTFEGLRGERWLDDWTLPPASFSDAARRTLKEGLSKIEALLLPRKKAAVRRVLKACVKQLNELDQQFGGPIETEEREDLMEVLWKFAIVSGHRSLISEVDKWRDW